MTETNKELIRIPLTHVRFKEPVDVPGFGLTGMISADDSVTWMARGRSRIMRKVSGVSQPVLIPWLGVVEVNGQRYPEALTEMMAYDPKFSDVLDANPSRVEVNGQWVEMPRVVRGQQHDR